MSRAARNGGMTLIEVMIALAILGLLSTGIIASFRVGQRTFEQVSRAEAALADVATTQRFLRAALESAYPFQASIGAPRRNFGLEGAPDALGFTGSGVEANGAIGYFRYDLSLAARPGGTKDLIVRSRLDRNGPFGDAVAETLLERVQSVEWSYRGPSDRDWSDHWGNRPDLPVLIRLRVRFGAGDARRWPDLVVATRITDDANCEFDVVAQSCRPESR